MQVVEQVLTHAVSLPYYEEHYDSLAKFIGRLARATALLGRRDLVQRCIAVARQIEAQTSGERLGARIIADLASSSVLVGLADSAAELTVRLASDIELLSAEEQISAASQAAESFGRAGIEKQAERFAELTHRKLNEILKFPSNSTNARELAYLVGDTAIAELSRGSVDEAKALAISINDRTVRCQFLTAVASLAFVEVQDQLAVSTFDGFAIPALAEAFSSGDIAKMRAAVQGVYGSARLLGMELAPATDIFQ